MAERQILVAEWFTVGVECVGIVVTENSIGQRKAYIGIGNGRDEFMDAQKIADYGSPVMAESLKSVLRHMGELREAGS